MSAEDNVSDAVYLAEDWMLYASTDISYEWSECAAPCLILGSASDRLRLRWGDSAVACEGTTFLHAAGVSSVMEPRNAALFLYFDPLTPVGLALQRLANQAVRVPEPCSLSEIDADTLRQLCEGTLPAQLARKTVDGLATAFSGHAPSGPRVDRRILELRRWFFEEFDGRLDLEVLAKVADMSGNHLRQVFRSQVGMTLSSYGAWVKLYQTASAAIHYAHAKSKVNATRLLSEVGFYDASHASKIIRRYLDLKPTEMLEPRVFVDCRSPSAASRPACHWTRTCPT